MVEVGIEAPFYARSRRTSVLDQALLPGRRHIEVLAAGAHEDRDRRLQGRIGHQRSRCDQRLRGILLETVLEGETLGDDLLLYGPEAGGLGELGRRGRLIVDIVRDSESR